MADLEIVHRKNMVWAWWLLGALLMVGLLWLTSTYLLPSEELSEEETLLYNPTEAVTPAEPAGG